MFAVTITTKDKCHNCPNEFDNELLLYLQSKGVDIVSFWYKLEESKYTKWHAHGVINDTEKWEVSKDDKFFAYFKECKDVGLWMGYCEKNEVDNTQIKYLNDGVFLQE